MMGKVGVFRGAEDGRPFGPPDLARLTGPYWVRGGGPRITMSRVVSPRLARSLSNGGERANGWDAW